MNKIVSKSISPLSLLLLLSIGILLLYSCTSPIFTADDDKAIRSVLAVQQAAWNEGDIDAFMEGYLHSDSLQFVSGDHINFGWQTTLDNYKIRYPDTVVMGKLHFNILRINPISPSAAFLTGTYHLRRTIGDAKGIFTLVLQKVDGKWLVVYDHTS